MIAFVLLLAQTAADPAVIRNGEQTFAQSCSVGYCHGVGGAAGRAPRLKGRTFDESYLLRVTRDGIPRSAMPAWKGRLSDQQIVAVVKYIQSLGSVGEAVPETSVPSPLQPATPARSLTPQVQRGATLFFEAARDASCGSCHALDGRGIAIGPDLTKTPQANARELETSLRATSTRLLATARLKDGESFPALVVSQERGLVKLYDLTMFPPVLRTLPMAEVETIQPGAAWNHGAFLKGIGPEQMADLAAYLQSFTAR